MFFRSEVSMVFSSPIFLFIFLPFVWILHAMLPERFRKAFLLFASLMFYIYGEGMFVMLMLATILTAHFTIVLLYKVKSGRKTIAVLGSALSLAFLLVFKHMNFFTTQISNLFALFSSIKITPTNFHLPLGVSFFTFQAVSCIIDFYRNPEEKEPKFIDTALYIAFFPQLVAGPIVRYDNFIPQLKYRAVHYAAFLYGLKRFAYGFAKKVLISNNLSPVVEKIYSMDTSTMGIDVAWAATFVFMVELYFDFSGYSDMAIGLARMFGIKIPENFTYPFTATSLGNMWRKWHISLSTWFRDYIYIPLGGSRKGEFRAIVNIWISFLACGLWHGAAWNFIFLGAVSAFFITIERIFKKLCPYRNKVFAHLYTKMVAFPLFFISVKVDSVAYYFGVVKAMFVPNASAVSVMQIFDAKSFAAFVVGFIFGFPVYRVITDKFGKSNVFKWLEAAFLLVLFGAALSSSTMVFSDPFFYFRF